MRLPQGDESQLLDPGAGRGRGRFLRAFNKGAAGTDAARLNSDDNERLWTGYVVIETGSERESCGNGAQADQSERSNLCYSELRESAGRFRLL